MRALLERLIFGARRRRLLEWLLDQHFRSLFRKQWLWAPRAPHFYDHRLNAWGILAGRTVPWSWYRAFYAAELMRSDDVVLDIGCGDGFFANRFFSRRAHSVDGIDIDPDAIQHARRLFGGKNVFFRQMDAVAEPFPRPTYDVIVWDGAIGHFDKASTDGMLRKIAASLNEGGAFCGSESLGLEGDDHLQRFWTQEEMHDLLSPHFSHVLTRTISAEMSSGQPRTEVFWRCAQEEDRLLSWQ